MGAALSVLGSNISALTSRSYVMAGLAIAPLLIFVLRWRSKASRVANSTAAARKAKAAKRAAALAALLQDAPEKVDDYIVNMSAGALAEAISKGELSAVQVLKAFAERAAHAQEKTNCLTEVMGETALKHATAIDEGKDGERATGLLTGVPISIKDCIGFHNVDSTNGVVAYTNDAAKAHSLIVHALQRAGANIFTKTNVPQTLLSYECKNPLWGRSLNPYHPNYTPGGSSGGEAALISFRGSAAGIGTDIGGSVRIPAHFSGIYALKPTARRVSTRGLRSGVPGQEAIPGVAGPMGNSVEDLALLMRALLTQEVFDQDHEVVPLPFNEEEYQRTGKLRVGYYLNDGFMTPSPACQRAVQEAADALRAAGHEVVEFKSRPNMTEAIEYFYALLAADGMQTVGRQLVNEEWEGYVKVLLNAAKLPGVVKQSMSKVASALGQPKAAKLAAAVKSSDVTSLWELQAGRKAFRQKFFDAWQEPQNRFDVLLAPGHCLPAIPHDAFKQVSFAACYTMAFNLLDFPAGVVPITSVRADDKYTAPASCVLENRVRSVYDPEAMAGLPLGVQVAGLPFQDAKVLRAMRELANAKPFTPPPRKH